MKRILALVCVLCLLLASCSSPKDDASSGANSDGASDVDSAFESDTTGENSGEDASVDGDHSLAPGESARPGVSTVNPGTSSVNNPGKIVVPNIDFSEFKDTGADSTHLLPRPKFSSESRLGVSAVAGNVAKNFSFEDGELSNWYKENTAANIQMKAGDEIVRSGKKAYYIRVSNYGEGSYPALCQNITVNPGDMISFSVWVRTYNTSNGVGPYTAIVYNGKTETTWDSGKWMMNTAVNGWVLSEIKGVVPANCTSATIKLCMTGNGEGAFDDAVVKVTPRTMYAQNSITLKKGSQVATNMGIGFQGDIHLWNETALLRGINDNDIATVKARMNELKPQNARVFFSYDWWEPVQFVRNSEYNIDFYNFVETLKLYKSTGTEVNICPWGDVFAYAGWQLNPSGNRAPPDDKIIPTAMSLSALLKYLIVDQKLDNIKYVTLLNEPDVTNNFYNILSYKKLVKALDHCLRQDGIRDKVKIVGSDDSSAPASGLNEWSVRAISSDVAKYFDVVSSHTYRHYFPQMAVFPDWIGARRNLIKSAAKKDLPFYIAEYGYDGLGMEHTEKYEYGLFIAEFNNTAFSAGTSMLSNWCIMNTYYTKTAEYHQFGTFHYKDKNFVAKPAFYSTSMFTTKTAVGDKVYNFTQPANSNISAVTFENASGGLTISVTNTNDRAMTITFTGLKSSGKLTTYTYSQSTMPTNSKRIPGGAVQNISGGNLTVTIPAQSFVMLSDR